MKYMKFIITTILIIISINILTGCGGHTCFDCHEEKADVDRYCLQSTYITSDGHIDYKYAYRYLCNDCAAKAERSSMYTNVKRD